MSKKTSILIYFLGVTCFLFLGSSAIAQDFTDFDFTNEVLRFDHSNNNAEYIFTSITDLIVDDMGNIYVSDASEPSIRVFSNEGKFLYKIGRRGRGPGEFYNIMGFSITKDNTLIVSDRFLDRVSEFTLDGTLIDTYDLPASSFGTLQMAYRIDRKLYLFMRNFKDVHSNGNSVQVYDIEQKAFTNEEFIDVYDIFYENEEPFEIELSKAPQYIINQIDATRFGFLSFINTGSSVIFDTNNNRTSVIGKAKDSFYTLLNDKRSIVEIAKEKPGAGSISSQSGSFIYLPDALNKSIVGNDKYIIKFYQTFSSNSEVLAYIEVYSSTNHELLTTKKLDAKFRFINGNSYSIVPLCLTNDGLLYTVDYYNYQEPIIRVFDLY